MPNNQSFWRKFSLFAKISPKEKEVKITVFFALTVCGNWSKSLFLLLCMHYANIANVSSLRAWENVRFPIVSTIIYQRTRHLGCLAHVRRYFVDSLKNSSCKASKSISGEIVKDIDEVFELERKLSAKFNDDERLNYRREKLLPAVKRVFSKIASVTASASQHWEEPKTTPWAKKSVFWTSLKKDILNCPTTAQSALSKRAWWGEKTGCFHQLLKAQGLMPLHCRWYTRPNSIGWILKNTWEKY